MSLVLQREALLERTGHWIAPMLRRQGFLIAAGLLHGTLLFLGDILLPYGILGSLALLALRWRPRSVILVACILLVLATLVEGAGELVTDEVARARPLPAPLEGPVTLGSLFPSDDHTLTSIELRVFREGPAWAAVLVRASEFGIWMLLSTFFSGFNLRVLALMLLGTALMALELARRALVRRTPQGLHPRLAHRPPARARQHRLAGHRARPRCLAARSHRLHPRARQPGPRHRLRHDARRLGPERMVARPAHLDRRRRPHGLHELPDSITRREPALHRPRPWPGTASAAAADLLLIAVALYTTQVVLSRFWLLHFEMGPLEWIWRCVTHSGASRTSCAAPLPGRRDRSAVAAGAFHVS
jgi:uncharacterized protein